MKYRVVCQETGWFCAERSRFGLFWEAVAINNHEPNRPPKYITRDLESAKNACSHDAARRKRIKEKVVWTMISLD